MFKILEARSFSLFQISWIKLGCDFKNDWCGVRIILDIGRYLFIEKGLRVGISYINKRHSKVNDQCMKSYDPTNLKKFISYLDMNNLE